MYCDCKNLLLDGEIWQDLRGYEDKYQVSNKGRIKTKERVIYYDRKLGRGIEPKTIRERIRKPKLCKSNGYLMIALNVDGKIINETVHYMVANTFIKPIIKKGIGKTETVNHIDGNKLNNNLENLEVVSLAKNIKHGFETGLYSCCKKVRYKGKEYRSKNQAKQELKLSERKLNKMIDNSEVELL